MLPSGHLLQSAQQPAIRQGEHEGRLAGLRNATGRRALSVEAHRSITESNTGLACFSTNSLHPTYVGRREADVRYMCWAHASKQSWLCGWSASGGAPASQFKWHRQQVRPSGYGV